MTTTAKDMIYDLLLGNVDADEPLGTYAHDGGVIDNGPDRAMATLVNMQTRERFRVTVQRVT